MCDEATYKFLLKEANARIAELEDCISQLNDEVVQWRTEAMQARSREVHYLALLRELPPALKKP